MKYIPLAFLVLVIACTEKPGEPFYKPLTEDEMYDVINEGFVPYLREKERDTLIYACFFEMMDSGFVHQRIREMQGQKQILFDDADRCDPVFEDEVMLREKIIGLTPLTAKQRDSLMIANGAVQQSWQDNAQDTVTVKRVRNLFAISRPYRPTGSPFAVIETYSVMAFFSCFPPEIHYYFFCQRDGKWTLVHKV